MEKISGPRNNNTLIFTLCIIFSIVSIVALILAVLTLIQKETSSSAPPTNDMETYCNLDVLNIGNYMMGVSEKNRNQFVIQSNLSTYPKIVFNLMQTDEPMMIVFNEDNYFYYSYKNAYDVVQNYEPNIFENYKICAFGCKQRSAPVLEFTNGVKIQTSNDALKMQGTNAQWSFNDKSNLFQILNTLQSSDWTNSFLFFDGQYLCSNPTGEDTSSCRGKAPEATLQATGLSASSPEDDSTTNEKINGISFSNGYTIASTSDGLILQGKYGNVKFNMNGTGSDIFTIENSLYYFYYSFHNTFGSLVKNNSSSGQTDLLYLGEGNPIDCSVWKGAKKYGISNDYQQPLQSFELKENTDNPETSIYYDYTYSNDYIFPSESTIYSYQTPSDDADQAGSSCNYLDRHNVKCENDNQYLYGFQLNYDDSNKYYYTINCADYPGGTTGCTDKSTDSTARDGNIQELLKNVKCDGDEYLTRFQLNTSDNMSKIDYRCCKMNVKN